MTANEAYVMNGLSLNAFHRVVAGILLHPRRFFTDLPESAAATPASVFLLVCAVINSVAGSIYAAPANYLTGGGICLANAVGLPLPMTGLGYALMWVPGGGRARFDKLFSVYAFSAGIPLLVSWVPSFLVLSEIWKWGLIATGLTAGLGFKWYRAVAIIGFSITLTVLIFHWLLSFGAR